MTGRKYGDPNRDVVCDSCGLVFSRRGIHPHANHCDLEEPILDPDRDIRPPSARPGGDGESPTPESKPPTDGERVDPSEGSPPPDDRPGGERPTPEDGLEGEAAGATTDGGRRAPPEPDLEDDDQDDDGCPKCGDDGIPVERLRERDDVDDQVADHLEEHGGRFCPGCSTPETAEVW